MINLIFNEAPSVKFATNTFINVPVILQYETTPLIEVVKAEKAGFTSQIQIYHSDGTYLAKAKGTQLYLTEEGKKAELNLRHLPGITVCEREGKTIFEIRREGPAALKAQAELFAPDGTFLKCVDAEMLKLFSADKPLKLQGIVLINSIFSDSRIGVWIGKDGSIAIGSNRN